MNEIQNLAERLSNVPHFHDIPLEGVKSIIQAGRLSNYQRNQYIFVEGHPCSGMYVLLEGKVTLNKIGPEGQISVLNILEPVIMFNEVATLDGGPNPVSAVAFTDARLWHIHRDDFQQLILMYPQIGISLLGILAKRNRHLVGYYGDLSFRTVQARLAKHLIELSEKGTQPIDRKQHPIKLIAARIVTTPEAVSRTLKAFKSRGLILCTRQEIRIKDLSQMNISAQIDI